MLQHHHFELHMDKTPPNKSCVYLWANCNTIPTSYVMYILLYLICSFFTTAQEITLVCMVAALMKVALLLSSIQSLTGDIIVGVMCCYPNSSQTCLVYLLVHYMYNCIFLSFCSKVISCILDGEMVAWDPVSESFL